MWQSANLVSMTAGAMIFGTLGVSSVVGTSGSVQGKQAQQKIAVFAPRLNAGSADVQTSSSQSVTSQTSSVLSSSRATAGVAQSHYILPPPGGYPPPWHRHHHASPCHRHHR